MNKTLSLGAFEELSENEIMETEGGGATLIGALIVTAGAIVIIDCFCFAKNSTAATDAQRLANKTKEPCPYTKIGPSAYINAYVNGWRPTDSEPLPTAIAYPA